MKKKMLVVMAAAVLLLGGCATPQEGSVPPIRGVAREPQTQKATPTPTPTPTAEPAVEAAPPAPAPEPVVEEAPAPPPAPTPVLCPPATLSNGFDGFNDTSCLPTVCWTIPVPDPAHPECDYAYPPEYYY